MTDIPRDPHSVMQTIIAVALGVFLVAAMLKPQRTPPTGKDDK